MRCTSSSERTCERRFPKISGLAGSTSDVAKTLSCTSLGGAFGEKGSATPPVPVNGDSTWAICDSATIEMGTQIFPSVEHT
jgi:hypothetical protein